MLTRRFPATVALAAVLAIPAIAAADVHRYTRVNQATIGKAYYNDEYVRLVIEGVLDATGAAQTITYQTYRRSSEPNNDALVVQECQRLATLALSKPGKYRLDIEFDRFPNESGGTLLTCGLRAVP